jgi:hypothetical protein
MPWLLDVIFTLEGRVRPYHKYLSWELHLERIETACDEFDSMRPDPVLMPVIEGWGDELQLLRR